MNLLKILFLTFLPLTLLFAQHEQKAKLFISNGITVKSPTEKTAQKDSVEIFQLPEKHSDEIEYIKQRLGKIREVRIITVMDGEYRGNLLYTSDSLLVICKGNGCYEWRTESVQSFNYSDIKKIVIINETIWKGLKWGFAIGAAIGVPAGIFSEHCRDGGLFDNRPLCIGSVGVAGGILVGIGGAIAGGIIGVIMGQDINYHIDESINRFRNALDTLNKESIFP